MVSRTRTRLCASAATLLVLLARAAGASVVGLDLLLALRRGSLLLDQGLKPVLLVHEEIVVLGVQGDGLLRQPVGDGAVAPRPALCTARLAHVVVGALPAPVTVADDGRRAASVAGDAPMLAEVGRLWSCGIKGAWVRSQWARGFRGRSLRARFVRWRFASSSRTSPFCSAFMAATLASISARFAAFAASSILAEEVSRVDSTAWCRASTGCEAREGGARGSSLFRAKRNLIFST